MILFYKGHPHSRRFMYIKSHPCPLVLCYALAAISSDNGRTWTIKALAFSVASDQWAGVAFGNNVFVATTKSGTINTWDGNIANNWVKQTTSQPSAGNYYFVNFVNGQFVMISSSLSGQQSTIYSSLM